MSRRRSNIICPKCGRTGSRLPRQKVISSHYAVNEGTTVKQGKWETIKRKNKKTGQIEELKDENGNPKYGFKVQYGEYFYQYFKHFDSRTKKQTKCCLGKSYD